MNDIGWSGDPGEQWFNDTGQVAFRFVCSFVNSCETCIHLHGMISFEPWPIPIHDNCGCDEEFIEPGEHAEPYVDYVKYVEDLPEDRRTAIIGDSNQKLIDAGLIDFGDVVTPTRIKTFVEIVKEHGLTVDEMVAAGIPRSVAQRAFNASKAEISEIIKRHRDALAKLVVTASAHADAMRNAVAAGIGGTPLVGPVPGKPAQPSVASIPALPFGGPADAEMAAQLAEAMKRWPNATLEDLLTIVEEMTRKKKEYENAPR